MVRFITDTRQTFCVLEETTGAPHAFTCFSADWLLSGQKWRVWPGCLHLKHVNLELRFGLAADVTQVVTAWAATGCPDVAPVFRGWLDRAGLPPPPLTAPLRLLSPITLALGFCHFQNDLPDTNQCSLPGLVTLANP